jgi:hypothetical protein
MTSYLPKDVSEEVLKAIQASQQTVVDAVRTWAEAVSPVLQSVPVVPIPFIAQLPKPEDVVTGAYEFAEKFLASQRQFSEELLKAAAPLVPDNAQREAAAAV